MSEFFRARSYDTARLLARNDPLPLEVIPRDDRYLVAEVACKTYDLPTFSNLCSYLSERFKTLSAAGQRRITARSLLAKDDAPKTKPSQLAFNLESAEFSLTEILDEEIKDDSDFDRSLQSLAQKFNAARQKALRNTDLYLSMVYDLDAYVATSMRTRDDFRHMADRCSSIFDHRLVEKFKARYFDPTLSAAHNHEDKGLIECLMVKCAKLLVYMAGTKESYGKDAEAAMALSQGKPVIFLCDPDTRAAFYREVHPLSRLIDFSTGTAVGAIVTDKVSEVPVLIDRILSNKMKYSLERKREKYFVVKEQMTDSVVRVQTSNKLLTETFWNYYHSNPFGRQAID